MPSIGPSSSVSRWSIFEPLRVRYRWASDRIHRFVIEGMRSNAAALANKPVTYFPYVEPKPGAGTPLLHQLAKHACTVVSDEYPCFFLPQMIAAVKDRIPARLELVDSNGVIPLRQADRTFTVAHSYRRWMQKNILDALVEMPAANPLARVKLPTLEKLPSKITRRWPAADLEKLLDGNGLDSIPIDHTVRPSDVVSGGAEEASRRLKGFVGKTLGRLQRRSQPSGRTCDDWFEPISALWPHLSPRIGAASCSITRIGHPTWPPPPMARIMDSGTPASRPKHFWTKF